MVFDGIDQMKRNAEPGSSEDFDFFVTAGDNLYPIIPNSPSRFEFERMMDLFNTRDAISDIPIYPVRGNHDCLFSDDNLEIDLSKEYKNWNFHEYYYQTQFQIGPHGQKMSLMHIDSCYLTCSTVGRAVKEGLQSLDSLDKNTRGLFESKCSGSKDFERKGDQMMRELKKAMQDQDGDKNLIWKASVMHHMMFGLHYSDYGVILRNLLPLIHKHKYGIYFNGHEHLLNYAYTTIEELDTILDNYEESPDGQYHFKWRDKCFDAIEVFQEHGFEE